MVDRDLSEAVETCAFITLHWRWVNVTWVVCLTVANWRIVWDASWMIWPWLQNFLYKHFRAYWFPCPDSVCSNSKYENTFSSLSQIIWVRNHHRVLFQRSLFTLLIHRRCKFSNLGCELGHMKSRSPRPGHWSRLEAAHGKKNCAAQHSSWCEMSRQIACWHNSSWWCTSYLRPLATWCDWHHTIRSW